MIIINVASYNIIIDGGWKLKENWLLYLREDDRGRHFRQGETGHPHSDWAKRGHQDFSKGKDRGCGWCRESIAINSYPEVDTASKHHPTLWGSQL